MTPGRIAFPFPIAIRRANVWFSELVGLLIVLLLFGLLAAIAAAFLKNEATLSRNHQRMMMLQEAAGKAANEAGRLREITGIATMLSELSVGRLQPATLASLTGLVSRNSRAYGYDPALLLAVIQVESVFRSDARGRYRSGDTSGALGLMQLKFETAQEVAATLGIPLRGPDDLFVPEINIALGVAYLTQLVARFRDLRLGILAYNQGPGTIRESLAGKRPLSVRYYEKVLATYYSLKVPNRIRKENTR
jgi:soluble lytic murein transglycosylase-like protein